MDFEDERSVTSLINDKTEGYADGTRRQYRQAARHFFNHLDREWADRIKVGKAPTSEDPIGRDDVLTARECDALLAAVDHLRDRALITTLLATGQRITVLLTLRVGDVNFEGERRERHDSPERGCARPQARYRAAAPAVGHRGRTSVAPPTPTAD